jgi:methionine sulfoxide reductase heme-binding subunit
MTLWYLMRGLGFSALVMLSVATALGALSTTGGSLGGTSEAALDRRVVRQLVHRSAAVVGLVLLGLHLVTVVLDSFVPVSVAGSLIPFAAGYRPFALGLGTLALYAFVLTAVSGYARGSIATLPGSDRAWRAVHASAYVGWGLAMLHGVLGGTDTHQPWAIAVYAACALAVGAAVVQRLAVRPRRTPDHRGHRRLTAQGALR